MRKVGIFLVVFLAILCGVVASGLAYAYLKKQADATAPELQPVVVASRDLTFGRVLSIEDLDVVHYPSSSIPGGAYSVPDSLVNQSTKVFLKKNEPILNSKLSSIGGGLSLRIDETMRAASVKVDKVSGVSGFVLPGDKVDVIVAITRGMSRLESVSNTILQNVEVLAAGEATERRGDQIITSQSVTLLVEPAGAQALALAAQEGKIILSLKNPTDTLLVAVEPVTRADIMGQKAEKPKPKPKPSRKRKPPAPPKPKVEEKPESDTLTIFRGADKKQETPVIEEKKKTESKP